MYVTGGPTVAYAAATGAMRWESAGTTVTASKTVVSPGGSTVFVTGTSPGSGGSTDYGTAAYDSATGAQLWTASYHGPGTGSDAADAIAVSPDGSQVFVTGESSNGTGSTTGFATVAYDASTGAQLWVARYDGPAAGLDDAVAVAVSPDGSKVFITGHSLGANGISGFTTLAYQAATGATVWTQRYNQENRGATAAALVLSPDGSTVYVTGASHSSHGQDATTLAYAAATGARQWTAQYDGPAGTGNSPEAMTVAPNGASVFVTGQTKTKAGQFIYSTQAYRAATGARIWAQTYAGLADSACLLPSWSTRPDRETWSPASRIRRPPMPRTTGRWPTAPLPGPGSGCSSTAGRTAGTTRLVRPPSIRPGLRCSSPAGSPRATASNSAPWLTSHRTPGPRPGGPVPCPRNGRE